MRFMTGVATLVLTLAMTASAQAADNWYRMELQAPILFLGGEALPPDGGDGEGITITIDDDTQIDGVVQNREDRALAVNIQASGMEVGQHLTIAGLPAGALWTTDPADPGKGQLTWSNAIAGFHAPTIEVRDADDALLLSQPLHMIIHPALTASVPQESYTVNQGGNLLIPATTSNAIGNIVWSGASILPGWLQLNDDTGVIEVDTSEANAATGVRLTAVDQFDYADATTEAFSVAVVGASLNPLQITQWLVVGGGGGGGGSRYDKTASLAGGGGGGGAVLGSDWDIGEFPLLHTGDVLNITVGLGGVGQKSNTTLPQSGGISRISRLGSTVTIAEAGGGGYGGRAGSLSPGAGSTVNVSENIIWSQGGNNGGTRGAQESGTIGAGHPTKLTARPGKTRNGFIGGAPNEIYRNGGSGGGGANGAGKVTTGNVQNISGGAGGNGLSSNITGSLQHYGQGGGGGGANGSPMSTVTSGGAAGENGSGNGGGYKANNGGPIAVGSGATNRGQGGGGAAGSSAIGGDGSSGIVVLRYPGTPRATGGTILTVSGDTVHVFTESGSFTVN